jgi:hypothetical protein
VFLYPPLLVIAPPKTHSITPMPKENRMIKVPNPILKIFPSSGSGLQSSRAIVVAFNE